MSGRTLHGMEALRHHDPNCVVPGEIPGKLGYFRSETNICYPIIGSGTRISGGVSIGGVAREIIHVAESEAAKLLTKGYEEIQGWIEQRGNRQITSSQSILELTCKWIHRNITPPDHCDPDDPRVKEYRKITDQNANQLVLLERFVELGIGVCRHMALMAGYCFERFQAEGQLHNCRISMIRNDFMDPQNPTRRFAHVWVEITLPDGSITIVDPTYNFCGDPESPDARYCYRKTKPTHAQHAAVANNTHESICRILQLPQYVSLKTGEQKLVTSDSQPLIIRAADAHEAMWTITGNTEHNTYEVREAGSKSRTIAHEDFGKAMKICGKDTSPLFELRFYEAGYILHVLAPIEILKPQEEHDEYCRVMKRLEFSLDAWECVQQFQLTQKGEPDITPEQFAEIFASQHPLTEEDRGVIWRLTLQMKGDTPQEDVTIYKTLLRQYTSLPFTLSRHAAPHPDSAVPSGA